MIRYYWLGTKPTRDFQYPSVMSAAGAMRHNLIGVREIDYIKEKESL